MAQSLRRPLITILNQPPLSFHPTRQLSSSPICLVAGQRSVVKVKPPPQQSIKAQVKEMADSNKVQMPNDLGLFEGTFVAPTGSNLPSFFTSPRERLLLEKARFQSLYMQWLSLIYYKFWLAPRKDLRLPKPPKRKLPRPKLHLFSRAALAKRLHAQMYAAFAAGDLDALRKICADGILASFRARIARRKPNERVTWTLHGYTGRLGLGGWGAAKVVSDRVSPLPMDGCALRQVVVRIRSRQSLGRRVVRTEITARPHAPGGSSGGLGYSRAGGAGERVAKPKPEVQEVAVKEEPGEVRELTEYVVVQRRMMKGIEEPWIVWGLAEETTVEALKRRDAVVEARTKTA